MLCNAINKKLIKFEQLIHVLLTNNDTCSNSFNPDCRPFVNEQNSLGLKCIFMRHVYSFIPPYQENQIKIQIFFI